MRSSGFFNHFMKMRLPYFIMSSIDFFATIRIEQLNTGDRQNTRNILPEFSLKFYKNLTHNWSCFYSSVETRKTKNVFFQCRPCGRHSRNTSFWIFKVYNESSSFILFRKSLYKIGITRLQCMFPLYRSLL